ADRLAAREAVYLLDVRQPWEHETAALPGSVLVPLSELGVRGLELRPPDGALVVAYCHHGIRSLSAAALLERLGIGPVVSLAGGSGFFELTWFCACTQRCDQAWTCSGVALPSWYSCSMPS